MGYTSGSAAVSYDMRAEALGYDYSAAPAYPAPVSRPRLDVVPGAGREADQMVSPAFVQTLKTLLMLVVAFCAVGAIRVSVAELTASSLNSNAKLTAAIETATQASSDLEVKRSVYGATTRIRDFATTALGMVESDGGVTLDVSDPAPAASTPDAPAAS
ncbi:hypothetical protein K6V98_00970 [Collinsella sp. AGMB00827]|uniref:Cell division protein FtsL n=1 Tax=Collinsella ureilytica TaxID=2869515 RepID=A0ABS7MKM2_9ACTN|nr:hypothetical protein [Collinsella urealyticum]MBY4796940.1 hypothetical protein [Collinsella urealyticum]